MTWKIKLNFELKWHKNDTKMTLKGHQNDESNRPLVDANFIKFQFQLEWNQIELKRWWNLIEIKAAVTTNSKPAPARWSDPDVATFPKFSNINSITTEFAMKVIYNVAKPLKYRNIVMMLDF